MKKLLLISVIFLLSCSGDWTDYKVKAGEHRSTNKVTLLEDNTISFQFTTDSTWYWKAPEKNGYSKITGVVWNTPHTNSARIVYMRLNDSIGLLAYYYYHKGVSPQQNHEYKGTLDTIVLGNSYSGRLGWENGFYFVQLGSKHHSIKVPKPVGVKILAHPYIGGTYTIDHDWHTSIKVW